MELWFFRNKYKLHAKQTYFYLAENHISDLIFFSSKLLLRLLQLKNAFKQELEFESMF